jgi:hypothetical protein
VHVLLLVLPDAVEYAPGWHRLQSEVAVSPRPLENVPAAQNRQLADADAPRVVE